jgi:Ca2+-binding RTX toxin-like protein
MATIKGTAVAETLNGSYSYDYIYGLAGNDIINGGYGSDYLYGDRDEYDYQSPAAGGNDTIHGGFNNDYIYGDAGADLLYGDSGNDTIEGNAGKDRLDGGDGDDRLIVGNQTEMLGDTVVGGTGIDTLVADFSARASAITFVALDSLATYSVGFTVTGVERYEITGSNFNDNLTGWMHDDVLKGGKGTDTVRGKEGSDELYGGDGADTIQGGTGNDYIYGDDYGQANADSLYGEDGRDSLYGGGGGDKLDGGPGNDTLNGDDGNDQLIGGLGDDQMAGGAGADTLTGGAGNDDIASQNTYYGVKLGDTALDKDIVDAGDGNDEVLIGVGDTAKGGLGTDIIRLSFDTSAVAVTYTLTTALTTLANGTTIDGFEQLEFAGGTGIDTITGGALRDILYGGGGNDKLTGGSGDDLLDGDDGTDTLNGGIGNDTLFDSGTGNDILNGGADSDSLYNGDGGDKLNGEAGNDVIYMSEDNFAADTVNGGTETDTVDFSESYMSVYLDLTTQTNNDGVAKNDRFSLIENVVGTYYDDVIVGDGLANTLDGDGSDDVLNGMGGNDRLIGGSGSDTMTGGAGADTFVLQAGSNDYTSYWPADEILDFVRGTDKLEIDSNYFGDNVTLSVGAGISSGGVGPHLHFDTATSRLWFDADGSGVEQTPVLIATLHNVATLAVTDFVVV